MILWGDEHENKARNLSGVVQEQASRLKPLAINPAGIPVSSDPTLTIWGHGGPESFAELTASQLAEFVKAWKRKNPALTTVELVTCDARHSTDNDDRDSFTDKLMPLLISSMKVLVHVKSLPRGGSSATTSALYAANSLGLDGYYFIAANDANELAKASNIFATAWSALPSTMPLGERFPAMFKSAKDTMDKAAMKGPVGYVTATGQFSKLRSLLVDVTVYIQDGRRLAVPKILG